MRIIHENQRCESNSMSMLGAVALRCLESLASFQEEGRWLQEAQDAENVDMSILFPQAEVEFTSFRRLYMFFYVLLFCYSRDVNLCSLGCILWLCVGQRDLVWCDAVLVLLLS